MLGTKNAFWILSSKIVVMFLFNYIKTVIMRLSRYESEVRYVCYAYYQTDLNHVRPFKFIMWSTAVDKKDLLDLAIRDWETYWCDHFGVFGNEWIIMDVWREYSAGYHSIVARRVSRRCPAHFRAIAEDGTLQV